MTLYDYILMFVDEEALVRLWTEHKHGFGMISKYDLSKPDKIDDVCLAREILNDEHWLAQYKDVKVLGCNDKAIPGYYQEATNLVIDLPENFIF